eukprot:scaffold170974_cov32-Tisochrysis_lutea.AAC.2
MPSPRLNATASWTYKLSPSPTDAAEPFQGPCKRGVPVGSRALAGSRESEKCTWGTSRNRNTWHPVVDTRRWVVAGRQAEKDRTAGEDTKQELVQDRRQAVAVRMWEVEALVAAPGWTALIVVQTARPRGRCRRQPRVGDFPR